ALVAGEEARALALEEEDSLGEGLGVVVGGGGGSSSAEDEEEEGEEDGGDGLHLLGRQWRSSSSALS
ncbi:hypothetical protein CRG98_024850, partial [Punica granatum]